MTAQKGHPARYVVTRDMSREEGDAEIRPNGKYFRKSHQLLTNGFTLLSRLHIECLSSLFAQSSVKSMNVCCS